MDLKKINEGLQKSLLENDLIEANEMQKETFSTIKSGKDAVIQSPGGTGKTTTIVINAIQRMERAIAESTRCLILVQDKEKVLEMMDLFDKYCSYLDLRYFGVHEKGDIDYANRRRHLYKQRHQKDRAVKFSPGWYADRLLW